MAFRQGVEGGFQGRTNKLVDGCYSFWQVNIIGHLLNPFGIYELYQNMNITSGRRACVNAKIIIDCG